MNRSRSIAVLAAVALSLGFALRQGTDRPFDHFSRSHFKAEIEGVTVGPFLSVSGLEAETEVIEFRDGSDSKVRKRPGATHYANVVLRRGYTGSDELWNWYKATLNGVPERKSGSIILLGTDMKEIKRYNFFEAWPVRYRNFELSTDDPGTLVEEIELAIELIERA